MSAWDFRSSMKEGGNRAIELLIVDF